MLESCGIAHGDIAGAVLIAFFAADFPGQEGALDATQDLEHLGGQPLGVAFVNTTQGKAKDGGRVVEPNGDLAYTGGLDGGS